MELIRDIWRFIRTRNKIWLLPAFLALVLAGLVVVLGASSAAAPFIYTVF